MRIAYRRRNNVIYSQMAYAIIMFWILHKVICNSTATNTAPITTPNTASTTFVTTMNSTANPNTSTTLHTSVISQTSANGNITNVTSGLSTITTVYSTELITTYTNTTISSFTNVTPNATSSYSTTITVTVTSNETLHNVSANTSFMSTPWPTNCNATTDTTYNLTNSSNACHTDTTIIRFKETNTTGIEGSNVTIKGNSTWHCRSVTWVRHYNRSTHGHHLGYRRNQYKSTFPSPISYIIS